jgi:hypothetical protein
MLRYAAKYSVVLEFVSDFSSLVLIDPEHSAFGIFFDQCDAETTRGQNLGREAVIRRKVGVCRTLPVCNGRLRLPLTRIAVIKKRSEEINSPASSFKRHSFNRIFIPAIYFVTIALELEVIRASRNTSTA